MDILGIGFPELLFIFIIALMVFGPRRLPEIAGKAGRMVRDLRNMSQGFLAEWQREITVAARMEGLEEVRKELEETKQSLRQSHAEIATGAAQIGQTIKSIAPPKNISPTTSPAQPAETVPQTSETTLASNEAAAPSEPTSPTIPPPETVDLATEPPLLEENADPGPTITSSANLSAEAVEITPETPHMEKNGGSTSAVAKPMPTVSPTEVAE